MYLDFLHNFQQRFQKTPNVGAAQAYESISLLAAALQITGGHRQGLLAALNRLGTLPGIQSPVRLDEYGDIQREVYIMRVEKNQFVWEKTLLPPS